MHHQNLLSKTPAKLFAKILILTAPLLIAFLLMEKQLSKMPNLFVIRKNYLERQLNSIQLLILGSSYGDSFNPQFFTSKAFTWNFNSQDFYYDQALLKNYIHQMPSLKAVIIPISFFHWITRWIDHWHGPWRLTTIISGKSRLSIWFTSEYALFQPDCHVWF